MKKNCGLLLIVGLFVWSSCSPKVSSSISTSYEPLDYRQEVVVIGLNQAGPEDFELLGEVKIGDAGLTMDCGYELVLEKASLEARKAGGNVLKIIEHKQPSAFGSSCHRIKAQILRVENVEGLIEAMDEEVILDVDYAILNVYRYGGAGAIVGYDLFLGDSVIYRVKNNTKTTLHIDKDGLNMLWAKTEAKDEVSVNFEYGKTYYLRCSIAMGAFVGRPRLELVDYKTGKSEFESFKGKTE